MKQTKKALAAGVSLSLALGMAPAAAFAESASDAASASQGQASSDATGSDAAATGLSAQAGAPDGLPESSYDKADFYSGTGTAATVSLFARSVSIEPRTISQDMLYFGAYEGGSYDCTFSSGDGYHALGYYQFDHRYGLRDFLLACYNYDPVKYAMFAQFANVSVADFTADDAIRSNGAFTALGNSLIEAWKAAYAADSYEFSRLQDDWAYKNYYLPAQEYLASRGIDISDRGDAVKGLCWSLTNLFGSTGWHKFVGGVADGYDWNGVYHYLSEGYEWPGCGLNDQMTDAEFVTTLCNYVVDNVAVFYKGQPQYHQGWQNRYKKELSQCLAIIERAGDTHAGSQGSTDDNAVTPEPDTDTDAGENGDSDTNGQGSNGGSGDGSDQDADGGTTGGADQGSGDANGGQGSGDAGQGGQDAGSGEGQDSGTNGGTDAGQGGGSGDSNADSGNESGQSGSGDADSQPDSDGNGDSQGESGQGDADGNGQAGNDGAGQGDAGQDGSGEDAGQNGSDTDQNGNADAGQDGSDAGADGNGGASDAGDGANGGSASDADGTQQGSSPDSSDSADGGNAGASNDASQAGDAANDADGGAQAQPVASDAKKQPADTVKLSELVKTNDGLGALIAAAAAAIAATVTAAAVALRLTARRR